MLPVNEGDESDSRVRDAGKTPRGGVCGVSCVGCAGGKTSAGGVCVCASRDGSANNSASAAYTRGALAMSIFWMP